MPANLITLLHLSASSDISFPKAADVIGIGSAPKANSRAFIVRSARIALISLLSLSMIAAGVSLGIPTDCIISLYELAHGRDVRQSVRTRRAGHCEGTQSTCLDIACRRRHRSKRYLHLPAEQIGPVTATIRHVYQVDTRHHLEQLARDMGAAPAAGRGHVDLARIGFRIGDELGNGFDWESLIDQHAIGRAGNARDRRNVADEIEIEVRI